MNLKYSELVASFPDDVFNELIKRFEQSDEALKEYIIELSFDFSKEILKNYWQAVTTAAASIYMDFNLDTMEKNQREKVRKDTPEMPVVSV